ncbi:MAG: thioredoxin family protein [Sulfuricurvum sp.]|nr:thioredoxin family protein [Sulfuricurvum sp.]
MKKLAMLLLAPLWLMGADIEWNNNFTDAQAKAKKESKPLLVLITSEQCRWCRKLESTTLEDEGIISKINGHFVPIHVTRDKSVYPKNLTAQMVPMSYFLDGNGKVLYSIPGYWPVEDYQSILDDALRKNKGK